MEEERTLVGTEHQELLRKIDEYTQLISDAENALDAAIMDLEELLEEEYRAGEKDGSCLDLFGMM